MTEGERIIKLETQMDNINTKVEEGFSSVDKRFDNMENMMREFISNSDKRFASKWVEKTVWGVAALIGTAFVVALLSLIANQPQ